MVLVVEDDSDTLWLVSQIIETKGIHCITSDSNESAIKKIQEFNPSIILLDFLLKDGNARPILKFCQLYYPKIKIIMMSAIAQADVNRVVEEFELEHCLPKPFQLEQLEDMVMAISN